MSIKALCSIHTITLLEIQEQKGRAMGTKRVLVEKGTKKCRVIPLTSTERERLGKQLGREVTHRIRFYFDPEIELKHWLKFRDTVMRPMSQPVDAHHLGRMWQMLVKETTWQSENIEVAD